jgi:predicted transcriptional regulator
VSNADAPVNVLECATCGNVAVARETVTCCGEAMGASSDAGTDAAGPSLAELLGTVFGMSETEFEVCLCVMEAGAVTVSELAEQTDYDRSIVTRHLNHLADLGVVGKNRRLLEQGGHVYVYTPQDEKAVRASLGRQFHTWLRGAAARLGELDREKVESLADTGTGDPQWKIFHEQ